MNVGFYHIHLTDDPTIWSSIFLEQMKIIKDYELYYHLDKLNIVAITQDDGRVGIFADLCKSYDMKMSLFFVKNEFSTDGEMMSSRDTDKSLSEDITLKHVYDYCETVSDDQNILYFHSKGTTSFFNNLRLGNIRKHKEYHYWRSFMNWGVLEKWRECIESLNTHDTAGANYLSSPSPHYCGNFWWAKASHIKKLPNPSNKTWWEEMKKNNPELQTMAKRMSDEMWVCSLTGTKSYDIVNLPDNRKPLNGCLTKEECEAYLK